jgi:hypothetical protein
MDASPTTQGVATKIDASDDVATTGLKTIEGKRCVWRRAFIRSLQQHGNIAQACRIAKVSVARVYQVRAKSPRFARSWKRALQMANRAMIADAEAALYQRGVEGVETAIVKDGKVIGHTMKYSDKCLEMLLKARKRSVYDRPKQVETKSMSVLVSVDAQKAFLSDPAYAQAICVADALLAAPRAIQGPPSPPCPADSASEAHGQTVRGVEE